MFAFLLMTARLSAPVNKEQLSVNSAVPRAVAEIKAQTPRYFLNVGGAVIEVDIKLKNSAVQTEDILAWVRRATGAVTMGNFR
jgi:uncharacterized protein YqgV (UPF0045/DUF77 family)